MGLNRRSWLKSAALVGGYGLLNGINSVKPLTPSEHIKFNPRILSNPIRLSSNENPYGPSQRVRNRVQKVFDDGCRYPYEYANNLEEILGEKHGVSKESIVITGGSTEGLKIAGITFTASGGEIIAAKPTFLAMMQYAQMWGADINWVPVNDNYGYDLQEIEKRISAKTKMVFICNPNNPTSTLLPADSLMDFCKSVSDKTIVFSDEAYYDYIDTPNYPSMVELVKQDKNIIVSKTFSKVYGMAGMRIGYLIAKPELAKMIRKNVVAMSNVYAIEGAKEALLDNDFYDFSLKKNMEAKKIIYNTLNHLELDYVKSHTNFIFFKSNRNISELGENMLAKGIKIGRAFPPFIEHCRISTGTIQEVQLFSQALLSIY